MDEVYVLIEHKIDGKEICGVFESRAAAGQAAQALWRRKLSGGVGALRWACRKLLCAVRLVHGRFMGIPSSQRP